MAQEELNEILEQHKIWLETDGERGERADLREADLRYADLQSADLREADLQSADLRNANLRNADLQSANLRNADLREADLREANLREANLREADLDYSCLPLWCGGLDIKIDDKIAVQILYHLLRSVNFSKYVSDNIKSALLTDDVVAIANNFHRVGECGEIVKKQTCPYANGQA